MTVYGFGLSEPYPPEFRRRLLDLAAAGRSVASAAEDLGVSIHSIYNWRGQDAVDRGEAVGLTSSEQVALKASRRRIAELWAELAVTRRADELLKARMGPKRLF